MAGIGSFDQEDSRCCLSRTGNNFRTQEGRYE